MPDTLRDLGRIGALLRVVVKYSLAPRLRGMLGQAGGDAEQDSGVRLRLALEELGMTYLKLGQYLAMRHDLVSDEVSQELQKLFERVTPASFDEVRAVVEAELGGPIERFYASFAPEPIASASVAQVHQAQLLDGQPVAVKVQRPRVRETFESDIRNFRRFSSLVDTLGISGTLSLREVVDEFTEWTARELDFELEGSTADRLRQNALSFEHAPVVHWELSRIRVLTMELIEGLSLAEIGRLYAAGGAPAVRARLPNLDLPLAIQRLATASLRQIFNVGFFHGDPHPGNIIIREDNTVVYVDFGIFGELTPYERLYLRRFVEAVSTGNIAEGVRYYMQQLRPTPDTDERAFRQEVSQVFRRWYEASANAEHFSANARRLGRYAGQSLALVRKHRLRMSLNTLLFWRAMDALDSSAQRFPGTFDLMETMREFFEPDAEELMQQVVGGALDRERNAALAGLLRDGTGQAHRALGELAERQGEWTVEAEESGTEYRANNRRASLLSVGLVGMSLLVLGLGAPLDAAIRAGMLGLASVLAIWTVAEVTAR